MSAKPNIAGAILAGGASSRMGEPKEGVLMPDGRAMIECVADAMRPHVSTLVVAGVSRGFEVARLGARRIDDLRQDQGPLAGIETILASGEADYYMIAACDQPLLNTQLLTALLPEEKKGKKPPTALALKTNDGDELLPFPCLLSAGLIDSVRSDLDAGLNSPRWWLEGCADLEWRIVSTKAKTLTRSINDMEDYTTLTH